MLEKKYLNTLLFIYLLQLFFYSILAQNKYSYTNSFITVWQFELRSIQVLWLSGSAIIGKFMNEKHTVKWVVDPNKGSKGATKLCLQWPLLISFEEKKRIYYYCS